MTSPAVRFVISLAIGVTVAVLVFAALPTQLDVRTDIVGYPTFHDFNVNRYFWVYGLTVGLFPLVTLAVFLLLTRTFAPSSRPEGPTPAPAARIETAPASTAWRAVLVPAGRVSLVGVVLGVEAAAAGWLSRGTAFGLTAAGYCALVALAAWLLARRSHRGLLDVASVLNTLAAPLTVGALYGVSQATRVTVTATGAVHDYPWLPLWVAVAATAVLLGWLARRLVRSTTWDERSAVERRALLLVVGPVGLFLTLAHLPGALGTVNFFEEGQMLAGADLTRDGAFPWRDLLVVHGLLVDVVPGLLGSAIFEDSRWALEAAQTMFLVPLYWIALYYLCVYLFGANWVFLVGTQLLVVTTTVFPAHFRVGLMPFVLLLLAALLRNPSAPRAFSFMAMLLVQLVVTPEALWMLPAYLAVLVLYELYYGRGRVLARLRRTWLCLGSGSVLLLAFSLVLLSHHALDDFVFSYRAFVPGHQLTGGIPLGTYYPLLQPEGISEHYEEFAILAPVALALFTMLFFVVRTRNRLPLAITDWVVLAASAFMALYYSKFLSRSDHVYHSFAIAVPVLFYAAYRLVTFGEAALLRAARALRVAWFPARHTITVPLVLLLLATVAPHTLYGVAHDAPANFAVDVPREPRLGRIGFDRPGTNDVREIRDLSLAAHSLLGPGDAVFDFTNAPGLFYYLLDLPASTRYYHTSIAMRQRTQTDLVRMLEKDRPKVVVYSSAGFGGSASSWDDISNQVRHYDVSKYLLDNYVPVLDSHGYVLMERRADATAVRRGLYFDVHPCDWGYAPNFFAPSPSPADRPRSLSFRRLDPRLYVGGFALDPRRKTGAKEVVATVDGRVVARVRPRDRRLDAAYQYGDLGYAMSGFGIVLRPPARPGRAERILRRMRVFAVSHAGTATELQVEPNSDPSAFALGSRAKPARVGERLDLGDGTSVRLVRSSRLSTGVVEAALVETPIALATPPDAARYGWLEVRTRSPLDAGRFSLADRLDESDHGTRGIYFQTLDRGDRSVLVKVGACAQWRGYRPGALYLTSSVPQDVSSIRLLR